MLDKRSQEVVLENVAEDSWVKLNPGTVNKIVLTYFILIIILFEANKVQMT